MKGTLNKTDKEWVITYKNPTQHPNHLMYLSLPIHPDDEGIYKRYALFGIKEGDELNFEIENIQKPNLSIPDQQQWQEMDKSEKDRYYYDVAKLTLPTKAPENNNAIEKPLSEADVKRGIRRKYLPVKQVIAKLNELKDPKLWKASSQPGGQDNYVGMPPAMRILDEIIQWLNQ